MGRGRRKQSSVRVTHRGGGRGGMGVGDNGRWVGAGGGRAVGG